MKKYILGRLVRSILSIFVVVSIAMFLIFTMIPKTNVFNNDPVYSKLKSDPVASITYKYQKWEDLGYLDFQQQSDICKESGVACSTRTDAFNTVKAEWEAKGYSVSFTADGMAYIKKGLDFYIEQPEMCKLSESNVDYDECVKTRNATFDEVFEKYTNNGYNVLYYLDGAIYAYRDYSIFEQVGKFLTTFVKLDNPWMIQDASNPDLERKIYIGQDHNGIPAIKCTGCESQYLIYFNSSFPFIHQNWISFDFGLSFPTYSGNDVMDVISKGQGNVIMSDVEFDTGLKSSSGLNLHTCKYKPTSTLDKMDKTKFSTNYANCNSFTEDPSMIGTSYLFGILGLILSYVIAIPAGIKMAQKKDEWQDKLGIVYINLMIAVPSLAFILFVKLIGGKMGLPDKFPQFGFGDFRSYILPVLILGLLSTAGLMMWTRRYMVDQANADYVKFARAKGLNQKEIFNRHILKNAIIPIVNGIPGSIILCISGAVITESVFAIPGMGKMLPDAIKATNNNMIICLTFIFTALSVLSLLLGDILMTFVDPRIQLSSKGETR